MLQFHFHCFQLSMGSVHTAAGGKDVDFALHVAAASNGGKLIKVPEACVVHPFWPGGVFELMSHFLIGQLVMGVFSSTIQNIATGLFRISLRRCSYRLPFCCGYSSIQGLGTLPWCCSVFSLQILSWTFFNRDDNQQYEYQHRCRIVQVNRDPTSSLEHHNMFYFAGHILANWYVVVLKCGHLWGHIHQLELLEGLCQRFDWHCGRLEKAPQKFRSREARKLGLSLCFVLLGVMFEIAFMLPVW